MSSTSTKAPPAYHSGIVEDLSAVRNSWTGIAATILDERAVRVSGRCCFDNIARDLLRFDRSIWRAALTRLFSCSTTGEYVEGLLVTAGPEEAASFVECYFGVNI